jgi:plasmid stabilization system protein ParE
MVKQIIWSPLAEKDLDQTRAYLMEHWNKDVTNAFLDIIENLISQISKNPKQFPLIHKSKEIRKCVLTRQNTLFYRFSKGEITVLRIFDSRQNPDKLLFE